MSKKMHFLCLMVIAFPCLLKAQINNNEKDTTEKVYSIYPNNPSDINLIFRKTAKSIYSNAIKLDITSLGRGNTCLIYERKIIPQLSAEITGGLKFYNGFYYANFGENGYQLTELTEYKKSKVKGIGVKYYFNQKAITDGWFVGLSFLSEHVVIIQNYDLGIHDGEDIVLRSYRFNFGTSKLFRKRLALSIGGFGGAIIPDKLTKTVRFEEKLFDFGIRFSTGFYFL